MINSYFDALFLSIPFYASHPYMMPFVGDMYVSSKHKKLLLIGESHYMPEYSFVHHNAKAWYNGTSVLNQEEQNWCNTRGTREGKSGRFGKEIDRCLNMVMPGGENGWHQVAFLNYFLRPADCATGIEDLWNAYGDKEIDCEQAIRNFINVLEVLKPDLFIFLSSRVCKQAEGFDYPKYFGGNLWDWTKSQGIVDYIYTNHPSSPHWNRTMPSYKKSNNLTSRDFFSNWLCDKWIST